jgi:cyclase
MPPPAKRVIPVLLLSKGRLVKTKQFGKPRDVGDPVSQAKVYYANGADELIILNIDPDTGIDPLKEWLPKIAEHVFVPITAGGGIRSVDDAAWLISQGGADKVVIRTALDVIQPVAERFGRQAVTLCVDFPNAGGDPPDYFGEVLLHSRLRDGMRTGYELEHLRVWTSLTTVPIVVLGGCGTYQHMLDAFESGADGCAAGSLFAFTDSNPFRAKRWLANHAIHVTSH